LVRISKAWVFYIGNPFGDVSSNKRKLTKGFVTEKSHPLLLDLDFRQRPMALNRSVDDQRVKVYPIVHKDGDIYLGEVLGLSFRSFIWNINSQYLDFANDVQWPLFWENLLNYRLSFMEGLQESNIISGKSLGLFFPEQVSKVQLKFPDGGLVDINNSGKVTIPPLNHKGLYTVLINKKNTYQFQVNLCDQYVSDLSKNSTEEVAPTIKQRGTSQFNAEDSFSWFKLFILFLAMSVLIFNLYLEMRKER